MSFSTTKRVAEYVFFEHPRDFASWQILNPDFEIISIQPCRGFSFPPKDPWDSVAVPEVFVSYHRAYDEDEDIV